MQNQTMNIHKQNDDSPCLESILYHREIQQVAQYHFTIASTEILNNDSYCLDMDYDQLDLKRNEKHMYPIYRVEF